MNAPVGTFASPAPNGAVEGESQTVGIRGAALHFPAMSLRMPSLQLPSLSRYRSNARMHMEAAEAPFVPHAAMPQSMAMVPAMPMAAPVGHVPAAPQSAPAQAPLEPNCSGSKVSIEDLIQALRTAREPQAAPSCSKTTDTSALDARLQMLEANEQRLLAQLQSLEAALNRAVTSPISAEVNERQNESRPAPYPVRPTVAAPDPMEGTGLSSPIHQNIRQSSYSQPQDKSARRHVPRPTYAPSSEIRLPPVERLPSP